MTVRPWSRAQPISGRQVLPERYQIGYTFDRPKLRSVDFTAAAEDNFFQLEDDATSIIKQISFELAVSATSAL